MSLIIWHWLCQEWALACVKFLIITIFSPLSIPVNCRLSNWGSWSPCILRKKVRSRTVVQPALNGGRQCSSDLVQRQSCGSALGWLVSRTQDPIEQDCEINKKAVCSMRKDQKKVKMMKIQKKIYKSCSIQSCSITIRAPFGAVVQW